MANRLFVVISLHTCLYHVVRPSNYFAFTTSGGPKQINQLDIRSLYPGVHSTTGFTGPYIPNTESTPRFLDQVIPPQIVSTDLLSTTMGSILPDPGLSHYQTSSQWTKRPGVGTGGFIRGVFQAAGNGRRLTGPISIRPACGVSESGGRNFHESTGSSDSGIGFSGWSSSYDESARHCVLGSNGESASSHTQSKSSVGKPFSNYDVLTSSHNELRSSISEPVTCKSRLDSNLGGSGCNYGGSISSYSGLESNGYSASSNTPTGCNFGRSYSNYDVLTSSNSGLGRNVGESVSSKSRSDSNLDKSYCSCNGFANSLGELVPSKGRSDSNFGETYYSYGSKHHHGSTNSNESRNGSGRKVSLDHGAVTVAGELPVVGRTTVVGRVPITGGVKFNGFIPAAGRVTIGGSCYCGPPFAF